MVAIASRAKQTPPPDAALRRTAVIVAVVTLAATVWSDAAFAYRPFDGTDAAVVDPGEFEVELGPAQLLREGSERTLIAPAVVLNLGLVDGWEAVLQGQGQTSLPPATARTSVVGNGAFLKGVVRDGALQKKPGPSVATEFGILLPGINDESGLGGSWAGIVSYRFGPLTTHFNVEGALTWQQHGDVFLGTILEGPFDWKVRPVAEVLYERAFGEFETVSGLVGAIWQVRENLAVDIGVREGRVNERGLTEVRLGVTFGFPLWRAGAD
jgi:hypothetical protein